MFGLKCKRLCPASPFFLHLFMNSWVQAAVAPPAHPGHAKTNTQVRRLQRKHTQHSYRQMKVKLLSLINPLPALAIKAADLEAFRESIYLAKVVEAAAEPEPLLLAHTSNMCSWCGIWQPLPSLLIDSTGELANQPTVAFSAAVAEPIRLYSDPDKNTTARDIEAAIDYNVTTYSKRGHQRDSDSASCRYHRPCRPPLAIVVRHRFFL